MSASRYRREGTNAYCDGLNPELECPYKDTYTRKCWIEGWHREERYCNKVQEEEEENEIQWRKDEIKECFNKDFDANYLAQMQADYEAGRISFRELLFMSYSQGFTCKDS